MPNPCNRDRTVKNVQLFIGAFHPQCTYAIQQFLEWFSIDRKLERIVWSTIKRREVVTRRHSEQGVARRRKGPLESELDRQAREVSREPRPMAPIGICNCGGLITGEPLPGCEARLSGRVFYRECNSCTYYSELFKIDKKYKEIEGGE